MGKENLWKDSKGYFLKSLRVDPGEKYRLKTLTHWNEIPSAEYLLKDFKVTGSYAFSEYDYFYTNGLLEKKITLKKSLCRIQIRAKGRKAGNSYPALLVWLDGKVVDSLYIDNSDFISFFTILQANPGDHVLGIEFINDYYGGSVEEDRNVWIKAVELYYPAD